MYEYQGAIPMLNLGQLFQNWDTSYPGGPGHTQYYKTGAKTVNPINLSHALLTTHA